MIKAVLPHPEHGTPIVILGLSDLNIDRLREGRPILVNLDELELPAIPVVVMAGRDEDSMRDQLAQHFELPEPDFVCPECGAKSWNPHDAEHGYCGRCHKFTGEGTP